MAEKSSYSKNIFTLKNIVIYLVVAVVVYGLVYQFLLKKAYKDSNNYSQTNYNQSTPGAVMKKMVVTLAAENSSGESGTVTLTEDNGKTKVSLTVSGYATSVAQPAHIHVGSCPGVGAVKYPLTNVVNGKSETTIDVTIDQLKAIEPLAINVHKSQAEAGSYVSCGALK